MYYFALIFIYYAAKQQHEEHNKAQRKLWSSTASRSDPRRLDPCLASARRKSEIDFAHLFLTIIQFYRALHLISQQKAKMIPLKIGAWNVRTLMNRAGSDRPPRRKALVVIDLADTG